MGKINAIFVILFLSSTAYADDIIVGDASGWTNGFDYKSWAASQTITTNDTLVFNYGPSHALNEVGQSDYNSCNPSNYITSASSSPTRVPLTTAGTRYFICPRSNHCQTGMKLAVTVSSSTGPTTLAPPSGSPTTPETPSTTGSQPPPPPSPAVRSGGGGGGVAGLLLLVMGAVFGFMG